MKLLAAPLLDTMTLAPVNPFSLALLHFLTLLQETCFVRFKFSPSGNSTPV